MIYTTILVLFISYGTSTLTDQYSTSPSSVDTKLDDVNNWILPDVRSTEAFRFFDDAVTWDTADAICRKHGARLVTVESDEKQDQLKSFMSQPALVNLQAAERPFWVGLRQWQPGGDFTWLNQFVHEEMSDPISASFNSLTWEEAPPMSSDMGMPLCVAVDPSSGFRWRSWQCDGPMTSPFICQVSVPMWFQQADQTSNCDLEFLFDYATQSSHDDESSIRWAVYAPQNGTVTIDFSVCGSHRQFECAQVNEVNADQKKFSLNCDDLQTTTSKSWTIDDDEAVDKLRVTADDEVFKEASSAYERGNTASDMSINDVTDYWTASSDVPIASVVVKRQTRRSTRATSPTSKTTSVTDVSTELPPAPVSSVLELFQRQKRKFPSTMVPSSNVPLTISPEIPVTSSMNTQHSSTTHEYLTETPPTSESSPLLSVTSTNPPLPEYSHTASVPSDDDDGTKSSNGSVRRSPKLADVTTGLPAEQTDNSVSADATMSSLLPISVGASTRQPNDQPPFITSSSVPGEKSDSSAVSSSISQETGTHSMSESSLPTTTTLPSSDGPFTHSDNYTSTANLSGLNDTEVGNTSSIVTTVETEDPSSSSPSTLLSSLTGSNPNLPNYSPLRHSSSSYYHSSSRPLKQQQSYSLYSYVMNRLLG